MAVSFNSKYLTDIASEVEDKNLKINLNQFKNLLEANDYDKLYQQIEAINGIREILEGINKTSKH